MRPHYRYGSLNTASRQLSSIPQGGTTGKLMVLQMQILHVQLQCFIDHFAHHIKHFEHILTVRE